LGQVDQAIGYDEQYLAIAREIGDRCGEGAALGNLGLAYAALGQVDQAIGSYEQQLAIAREIGDRRGAAFCSWNWGEALVKLGRLAEAMPLLAVCLAYEREIGHPNAEKDAAYVERLRRQLSDETAPSSE
jgi:tetratricopeptide (TPR) repeat protein